MGAESEDVMEEEMEEERMEDETENRYEVNDELADAYGAPPVDEKDNQHSVIRKAMEKEDPTRVTFLTENELGRPVFSLRFYLDMEDLALHYGCNRIADYWKAKVINIAASGMSNKGFLMNLAATRKHDTTRRRVRPFQSDGVKGGEE